MAFFRDVPYGAFQQDYDQFMVGGVAFIQAVIGKAFFLPALVPVFAVIFVHGAFDGRCRQVKVKASLVIFMGNIPLQVHILHVDPDTRIILSFRDGVHEHRVIVEDRLDQIASPVLIRDDLAAVKIHHHVGGLYQDDAAFGMIDISLLLRFVFHVLVKA